jgi:hypothetical protein
MYPYVSELVAGERRRRLIANAANQRLARSDAPRRRASRVRAWFSRARLPTAAPTGCSPAATTGSAITTTTIAAL